MTTKERVEHDIEQREAYKMPSTYDAFGEDNLVRFQQKSFPVDMTYPVEIPDFKGKTRTPGVPIN